MQTISRSDAATALQEMGRLAHQAAEVFPPLVEEACDLIAHSLRNGGHLLACGNGGSAAEVQHMVAELVGRFLEERAALPAIALTSDSSILTAVGNDYGFEALFARQVEALGGPGDVLVVFSTSGRSGNILRAVEVGRQRGMQIIALVGSDPAPELASAEVCFKVPSSSTPRIQEIHQGLMHCLCDRIEQLMFGEPPDPE